MIFTGRAAALLLCCYLGAASAQPSTAPTMPTSQASSLPRSQPSSQVSSAPPKKEGCSTNEAISVLPLAFRRAGVSLQYERQLVSRPYSLAGALGLRVGARAPTRSMQYALGLELKRWGSLSYWRQRGAFYGVGRFDVGAAFLRGGQAAIGSSFLMESNLGAGYRFVFKQKVELSLASTLGLRAEVDRSGLLPALWTGTVGLWCSVGYLF